MRQIYNVKIGTDQGAPEATSDDTQAILATGAANKQLKCKILA